MSNPFCIFKQHTRCKYRHNNQSIGQKNTAPNEITEATIFSCDHKEEILAKCASYGIGNIIIDAIFANGKLDNDIFLHVANPNIFIIRRTIFALRGTRVVR